MTSTPEQAREDLAFLRNLTAESDPFARSFGTIYGWAGLLFGLQCLAFLVAMLANYTMPGWLALALSVVPTVAFLAILIVALVRNRKRPKPKGPIPRAIDAAFDGTGLANLVMITVFGVAAAQRGDFTFWLFYAVTVCAIQGAVWYGAAILRRRWWMGGVAAGWLVSGLATGLLVDNIMAYLGVLTVALFAFMAAPGFFILRQQKAHAGGAQARD